MRGTEAGRSREASLLTLTIFTAASVITPLPWFSRLGWSVMTVYGVTQAIRSGAQGATSGRESA
ncbi:hypothetical protein [Quadrisphaera sp. INWT6]|uniref:hypothetical protein n=1 Tax=Quadrisphaera sp. INWT6 TaxID=2596917 RepID=UPI0018922B95|nr:hypothetical protein [Quadrisphaera sp. INWT6]MBF5083358.1 hypothetical protein [Quadrisphaera sp. INWT6]